MSTDDRWAAAVAEVRRRVEQGRRDGTYPEDLDLELASQFARAGKDPLTFSGIAVLRERAAELAGTPIDIHIDPTSSIPGGSGIHLVVSKIVSRQAMAIARQLSRIARGTASALDAAATSLDEIRAVLSNDVLGDLDALHHRLVALEHKVARLELEDSDLGEHSA